MDIPEKIVNKIIGKKKFQGKGDSDYDGVKDSKDCQPHNPLRQELAGYGERRIGEMKKKLRSDY